MSADPVIRKGFVNVGDGQVHFRSAGSGPPVIFLHDSPRSSVLHVPQLKTFADRFTCIAIDTPGYGNSTPLAPGRQLTIPDFGKALAETVLGFGVERCPVYGFHTSSKITLAFAAAHPERVAVAILDGLSLPPGPPNLPFIDAYMKPFVIEATGGYLGAEWTRVLDFQRWFPWFSKTRDARQATPAKPIAGLHEYAMDLFMAGPHFSDAYGAAMRFQALPMIGSLRARTVFMCRQDDVLHAYLAALPSPLPEGSTMESLAPGRDVWRDRLRALFMEHADWKGAAQFTAPNPFDAPGRTDQVLCSYVDLPNGQLLVRRAGIANTGRPIVFLHDLPGSARADHDLLLALAQSSGRPVYAIDLPGCNESSPPPEPTAQAVMAMIAAAMAALSLRAADVIAEGLSTSFAALLAKHHPNLVNRLILDAVFVADSALRTEMRVNYTPDLRPQRDGTHLHRGFHMLRDQEVSWPWYDGSSAAIRRITPRLDAERLHTRLVDTLKQHDHYSDSILAACDVDVAAVLADISQETLLATAPGDVRYTAATAVRPQRGRTFERPQEVTARAAAFVAALG